MPKYCIKIQHTFCPLGLRSIEEERHRNDPLDGNRVCQTMKCVGPVEGLIEY